MQPVRPPDEIRKCAIEGCAKSTMLRKTYKSGTRSYRKTCKEHRGKFKK